MKSLLLLIVLGLSLVVPSPRVHAQTSNATSSKTIVIAIDGLSHRAFIQAQKMGYFQGFNLSANIAPFPTMTDLSWSHLFDTTGKFGNEGRIRSVEAVYFDESTRSVRGDPRDYYHRLAKPKFYLSGFDSYFNPYVEGLMYLPTDAIPRIEVDQVLAEIQQQRNKSVVFAYLGAVDAIAHTQKDKLWPFIKDLDSKLKALQENLKQQEPNAEIILVSDHGNIGRFEETQEEQLLASFDTQVKLEKHGYKLVNQIKNPEDAAIPLMALGSWAPVYLGKLENRDNFISSLITEPEIDLAVFPRVVNRAGISVQVRSAKGLAHVQYSRADNVYYYLPLQGNPLEIDSKWHSIGGNRVAIQSQNLLQVTQNTNYPDSIYRLIESATMKDFDFPDLILTLKDGYYFQGPLGGIAQMVRTHGSLSKNSSLGILASNKRKFPSQVRMGQVMQITGVNSDLAFARIIEAEKQSGLKNAEVISTETNIRTAAKDYSTKTIFQILTKFIADTRHYFDISDINSILAGFKFLAPNQGADQLQNMRFDISNVKIDSLVNFNDLGELTDVIAENRDGMEGLKNHPFIQEFKNNLESNLNLQSSSEPFSLNSLQPQTLAVKRSVMKIYQIGHAIEGLLVFPEETFITDTRDKDFSLEWRGKKLSSQQNSIVLNQANTVPSSRMTDGRRLPVGEKLFLEIFKEQKLAEQVYPYPIKGLYQDRLKKLTVVYVPGIYNSIFDRDIFMTGLTALAEDYGVRVLTAPVESGCSAKVNANTLYQFLKADFDRQAKTQFRDTNYVIFGYSKGGVDAIRAAADYSDFFADKVKAIVTIGSPLQGASIVDKSDIPFELVELLSENQIPEICKTTEKASNSVTPSAMANFWRQNARKLVGITRYFSVSFVSTPENSHPFMRATKIIGQFDEPNDGVVALSASKFPQNIPATDLGIIQADHLAGISISKFPQKAFLKAIATTLAEVGIENESARRESLVTQMLRSPFAKGNFTARSQSNSYQLVQRRNIYGVQIPLTQAQSKQYNSLVELNANLLEHPEDPSVTYQVTNKMSGNQLNYDPYYRLKPESLPEILQTKRVSPTTPMTHPQGITIEALTVQSSSIQFRMEHQMNFENRSPVDADDNTSVGHEVVQIDGEPWMALRSTNSSARLTTLGYRFKVSDYPKFSMRYKVTKGPKNADPVKGKTGKDDSALQVWFNIRVPKAGTSERSLLNSNTDHIVTFGYYWGEPVAGENRKAGDLFENWYSKKNFAIAVLPEAWQILINNPEDLGQAKDFQSNLLADLQRAFPAYDARDMEIVSITIQQDSNDVADSSEAFLRSIRFQP